jgi:hypothetical protein
MTKEKNTLIARRVPPGDNWMLCTPDGTVIFDTEYPKGFPSLTHVLEGYFVKHQYKGNFVISPSKGEIYMITTEKFTPEPPKRFTIYGDH